MHKLGILLLSMILTVGCGQWGDYIHKSSNFDFEMPFPPGWGVIDDSEVTEGGKGGLDLLIAQSSDVPNGKIVVTAELAAPDLSPGEVYHDLTRDVSSLTEYKRMDGGTVACRTTEGRYVEIQYLQEEVATMRGMRAIFVGTKPGTRVIVKVKADMPRDDYLVHRDVIMKMMEEMSILP